MNRSHHKVALLFLFGLSTFFSFGQSLPAGTSLLEIITACTTFGKSRFNDFIYFKTFLPVLSALYGKAKYGETEIRPKVDEDELASMFIRWVLPREYAELHFDYGSENHTYEVHNPLFQPDHSRAYILDLQKYDWLI